MESDGEETRIPGEEKKLKRHHQKNPRLSNFGQIGREQKSKLLSSFFFQSCHWSKTILKTTRHKRMQWLLANPKTWVGIDFSKREMCHNRRRHCSNIRILFEMMQSAGLYAPSTVWSDTCIKSLVSLAHQLKNSSNLGRCRACQWPLRTGTTSCHWCGSTDFET
jgi:hypothetical protein